MEDWAEIDCGKSTSQEIYDAIVDGGTRVYLSGSSRNEEEASTNETEPSEEAIAVAKGLMNPSTHVKEIFLTGNNIGDFSATETAKALETNTTLTSLVLYSNRIGDDGATAIAKALETNTTLTSLSLSFNRIGNSGAAQISKALGANPSLQELFLSGNEISDDGATAIAKALNKTTTLTTLDLSVNKISDPGSVAIAKALETNTSLEKLSLSGNDDVGDNGAEAISKASETNTSLKRLDISYSKISDTGATAIAKALEKNTSLEELYLDGCILSDDNRAKIRGLVTATYDNSDKEEFERKREQHKWYNRALLDGRERPCRIRLMISGPYGVGKTSLVRSLQGKPFDSRYESTVGIDAVGRVDKSTLGGEEVKFSRAFFDWRAGQPTSDNEDPTGRLQKKRVLGHYPGASLFERDDASGRKKRKRVVNFVSAEAATKTPVRPAPQSNHERGPKKLCMTVWDFAGQIKYHAMHQMFFRQDCLYVLVLDLQENATRQRSTEDEMLVDAQRWLNAIVSSTGPEISLIVVGTHADCFDSWNDAKMRLDALVDKLKMRLPKVERYDVIRGAERITVDNKKGLGIETLRSRLEQLAHEILNKMDDVPLRWLRFFEVLVTLVPSENHFCVPLTTLQEETSNLGFKGEEETTAALSYFDKIGEIVYIQEEGLTNWVFSQPHRLLRAMKSLLPLRNQTCSLFNKGFLDNEGLSQLWTECGFEDQEQLRRVLAASGLIMNMDWGVVVPACLPDKVTRWPEMSNEREIVIETSCSTHLPPSLFHYLMARLYHAHGRKDQELSLITRTSGCLALAGAQGLCFRGIISVEQLRHSITIRVRVAPIGKNATKELHDVDTLESALLAKSKSFITDLHRLSKERFDWMSLTSKVQFTCADVKHSVTVLESKPGSHGKVLQAEGVSDLRGWIRWWWQPKPRACEDPCLKSQHTCEFGILHSLSEAIWVVGKQENIAASITHLSTPPLPFSEEETEQMIAKTYALTDLDDATQALNELVTYEEPLVKWLSSLATLEVLRNYKPSLTEIDWVRRIGRLYHRLVDVLKVYVSLKFDRRLRRFTVFVSHTGSDKNSYAAPVSDFLTEHQVNTFLDRTSIDSGDKPNDTMLCAAMTCRYMWCVVSRDFVQKWYPMRELMIAYARHIQEDPDNFRLLVDCHEKEYVRGLWMEMILNGMESLKLYDRNGESHPFPGSMKPARMEESFSQRYRRLAADFNLV